MQDKSERVDESGEQWAAAELRGDTPALGEILVEDFVGVGPRGFTLTKEQWISRHETGSLEYESFGLDEVEVRLYGEARWRCAARAPRECTRTRTVASTSTRSSARR